MRLTTQTGYGTAGVLAVSLLLAACRKPDSTADAAQVLALQAEVERLQSEKTPLQEDVAQLKKEITALRLKLAAAKESARAAGDSGSPAPANGEIAQTAPSPSVFGTPVNGAASPADDPEDSASGNAAPPGDIAPAPASSASVPSASPSASSPSPSATAGPGSGKPKAAPVPLSAADSASADEMAKKVMPEVVIIEGDAGSGSGFFIRQNDSTYLYTAAHVFSGNSKLTVKTADGRKFSKFGTFEVAEGYDLVRLQITEDVGDAGTLSDSSAVVMNRPVFAIGNSGGGGVLTVIKGSVTGVGPSEFEVDAGIIQGNSGGPVFDVATGKVMGVVTHAIAAREDIWAAETRFADVRRFAGRLDGQIRWRAMPIGAFLNERRQIEEMDRGTRLLFALSMLRPGTSGLRMNTSVKEGVTAMQIFNENQDQQAVKDLIEMNSTLQARGVSLSEKDLIKKFTSFYGQILAHAQRQTKTFDPSGYSPYHKKDGEQSIKWRSDAEKSVISQLNHMPH